MNIINITDKINIEYNKITTLCYNDYFKPNKRDFALIIKEHLYKTLLFKMYDTTFLGKDSLFLKQEPYHTIIFRYIETSEFFEKLKKEDLDTQLRDTYANSRHYNILNNMINSDEKILTEQISTSKKPRVIFLILMVH